MNLESRPQYNSIASSGWRPLRVLFHPPCMNTLTKQSVEGLAADTAWWQAVLARDRASDGRFVYAVTSTGVYCRPSCPSRRPTPRSRHVFRRRTEAARESRLPRLQALSSGPTTVAAGADPWVEKVRRACVYLSNVDGAPRAGDARGPARWQPVPSAAQLQAAGRRDPARVRRGGAAAQGERVACVSPATSPARCSMPGYGSSSRFYERAVPKLGMAPSVYRRGGAGMQIGYTIVECAERVARTAAGGGHVAGRLRRCNGIVGHRADARAGGASIQPLRSRPTPGRSRSGRRRFSRTCPAARPRLDLPLDVQATAFQWQVWQALASIPYGETRTYSDVASSIGKPRAVRAVARACASNPVALAIPCHRVVPAAGGEGGYRWGVNRKKALLRREGRRVG